MEWTTDTIQVSPAQVNNPAEGSFEQAALTALERLGLYLIPHLPHKEYEQLVKALWAVRRALKLPAPRHPMLDLRDWPDDAQAGGALEVLLGRLDELERQP